MKIYVNFGIVLAMELELFACVKFYIFIFFDSEISFFEKSWWIGWNIFVILWLSRMWTLCTMMDVLEYFRNENDWPDFIKIVIFAYSIRHQKPFPFLLYKYVFS